MTSKVIGCNVRLVAGLVPLLLGNGLVDGVLGVATVGLVDLVATELCGTLLAVVPKAGLVPIYENKKMYKFRSVKAKLPQIKSIIQNQPFCYLSLVSGNISLRNQLSDCNRTWQTFKS